MAADISQDDLVAKFLDCVSYSVKPISIVKVKKLIGMINKLENIKDVSGIMRLLA